MDRGVWQATVHGVTKSWTWLSMHAGTTSRTLNLQPFLGYLHFFFFLIFWPCHAAPGILVPQPGMEPMAPALEVQSLNRWTTRESQVILSRLLFQQKSHWYLILSFLLLWLSRSQITSPGQHSSCPVEHIKWLVSWMSQPKWPCECSDSDPGSPYTIHLPEMAAFIKISVDQNEAGRNS